MKVLHVSTRYPPGPGGVERHVREVVLRLRQRGLDASVLTSDLLTEIPWVRLPAEVARARITEEGIPILRHRAFTLPGDMHYPLLPGLSQDIRRLAPDLVHVHTYGTYQGFSALVAERVYGIPYVITAHYHPTWSIWGGEGRKRLRRVYDRLLASGVLRHASRLVLQTPEEERLMREVVPNLPPVSFIPPGYTPLPPPSQGTRSFRALHGIPGPYVLFVGRLASNKGLATLVRAFGRLASGRPDVTLALVGGDGGAREETISLVHALGLDPKVKMIGFVEDEGLLSSAYHEASMLVLPSEYEAFGLVLLEAMAQGTPVVASRVGGMPGVVDEGRNGLLVPVGDVPALSGAMERLLSDPELAHRMGEHGRTVTVPAHTWERVASQLTEMYAQVRDARGAR